MSNYSITIAREYGSGGRLIGKQLVDELGILFNAHNYHCSFDSSIGISASVRLIKALIPELNGGKV